MAKLFIFAGHGAGDPGACANGYTEAERVRELAKRIKELGGDSVMLGDVNRNYYADGGINSLNISRDYQLCELHMDSASPSARGGHVIINGNYAADEYDKALASFICGILPGRSKAIVPRTDLANLNRAAARGYSYRLIECGFISNAEDVAIFNANIDNLAKGILGAFGIGSGAGSTVAPSKPSNKPAGGDLGRVTITYALMRDSGAWWPSVSDFNNANDSGYAGAPYAKHKGFWAIVDKGSIRYKVHKMGGGWTREYRDGESCVIDGIIDGIACYYATPDGYSYQQAYYRSQTTKRSGYLGVCCDYGMCEYDGWAGMYGEPLDRFQAAIRPGNPF